MILLGYLSAILAHQILQKLYSTQVNYCLCLGGPLPAPAQYLILCWPMKSISMSSILLYTQHTHSYWVHVDSSTSDLWPKLKLCCRFQLGILAGKLCILDAQMRVGVYAPMPQLDATPSHVTHSMCGCRVDVLEYIISSVYRLCNSLLVSTTV